MESAEVDLEDCLLGGLIDGLANDPAAVVPLLGVLRPEHFGRDSNRAVFGAVVALHRLGCPIDLVAAYRHLCDEGPDRQIAGVADLVKLWEVRCDPGEAGELARRLARGVGRCTAAASRPPPPPPAPPGGDTASGEADTSFEFGANRPDDDGGG